MEELKDAKIVIRQVIPLAVFYYFLLVRNVVFFFLEWFEIFPTSWTLSKQMKYFLFQSFMSSYGRLKYLVANARDILHWKQRKILLVVL